MNFGLWIMNYELRKTILFLLLCCASALRAQYYQTYTTTADGKKLMEMAVKKTRSTISGSSVILRPSEQYQTMEGFGYAMTYSACYNLLRMQPRDRQALLRRTFSATTGYGCSYVRISIGCSDFSSTEYTLCDKQGLSNFALQKDETDFVIPILKEILQINPQLKIIAAPWTCPRWMKVRSLSDQSAYNSWTGGHLNPRYYADYAQYFVRFVQAFQAQGIPIYAVTPQNEPLNGGNCASLLMPWNEQAAFLQHLAPAFAQARLQTKIYVFDHNYNYDGKSDQLDYPIKVYDALGESLQGRELIVGSAWHNYGGSPSELDDIHQKAPLQDMIFTEASIGEWNDGRNLSARLLYDTEQTVIATVNRYCSAVLVWNYMLDLNKGPNLDGGCTTCYGALDIDQNDYHTVTANSHFYMISHIAAVVRPGAVRIGTNNGVTDIQYACFQNPDGTYGIIATNSSSSSKTVCFGVSGIGVGSVNLPSKSVVSVLLSAQDPDLILTLGGHKMSRSSVERFTLTAALTQGEVYEASFLNGEDISQWYIDPDFFRPDEDGHLRLMPQSDTYLVTVNLNERSLTARPTLRPMDASGQGSLFLLGPAGSIGKPYYIGGTKWDPERAIPLAEVHDQIYQTTITVGEQLNPSYVEFGIYGNYATLEPQFMGRTGSEYRLTLSNVQFDIGKGYLGHTDGIVYLRSTAHLQEGDTYLLTIDLTNGVTDGLLTIEKVDLCDVETREIVGANRSQTIPEEIYNLQGQRLTRPPHHGIYIFGKKKIIF
ncbi:MAG: DUF5121 domain-containing protein [Bacteroidaceae bacterium]|nr:DUF5121 domain-containing protein [Bacteroidaceae bacterium]